MKRRPRINYTESQKALMWERSQKGDSLEKIAQLFDRHHPSVERILAESGGIRPAPRFARSDLGPEYYSGIPAFRRSSSSACLKAGCAIGMAFSMLLTVVVGLNIFNSSANHSASSWRPAPM